MGADVTAAVCCLAVCTVQRRKLRRWLACQKWCAATLCVYFGQYVCPAATLFNQRRSSSLSHP